jgi:predicted transport protein
MAKSPEDVGLGMVERLPETTGRSLDEWRALVASSALGRHGEIVRWLKGEHGVTHGYANLIAHKCLGSDAATLGASADLVASQYAGAKAALRPLYDRLVEAVAEFGPDVEVAPKKGYVSLRRSKQFGLIQPSTASRLDLGLCLKGTEPEGRLEAAGSWNAMATHRIRVASLAEIDAEVIGWLRRAYELA